MTTDTTEILTRQLASKRGRSTAPPAGRVELFVGREAILSLGPAWERLIETHARPVPWLTFEAAAAALDTDRGPWSPFVAAVTSGGAPRILVPLERRRRGPWTRIRPLGHPLARRHEPLLLPDAAAVPPAVVFGSIARRMGRGTVFDLPGMWLDSPGGRWLSEGLGQATGWRELEGPKDYDVPLHGGWSAVQASLRQSFRERARRGQERAARRGGIKIEIVRTRDEDELRSLFDLARRQGRQFDTPGGLLVERFVRKAAGAERIVLCRAFIGAELAAGMALWVFGGVAVELISADEPAAEPFAPAASLGLALLRRLVVEERTRTLILSPGHNPDTVGLCGTPRPQLRFVGAPRRGLARLAVGAAAWAGDESHVAPALVRAALRRVAAARAACADLFAR